MVTRRQYLYGIGAAGITTTLAGCSGGGGDTETTTTTQDSGGGGGSDEVTVAVGPDKKLRFEPEDVEIPVGGTVHWEFESEGHNVTSLPGASDKCENPEGAEPFASYDGNNHFSVDDVGETFSHTFEVAGKYTYVCAPHAGQGMVGTVTVTE